MIKTKIIPLLVTMLIISSIGASAAANTTFNTTQISQSAGQVKSYVETNGSLPANVTVGDQQITPSQFLYLLTTGTQNVNSGNTTLIALKNVSKPSSPTETLTSGTIAKSEYLTLAGKINAFISANGRLPNYVTTSLGTMRYESLVYMYSKIMNYYGVNKVLPNTVSVKPWSTISVPPSPPVVNYTNYTTVMLGETSQGFVQKLGPFGTGTNKIAIIIGVHPQEGQGHLAMLNALKALAATNSLTNVKIYVFKVVVYNATDYTTSRTIGQNLANQFIVPNIDSSYKLAMDTHTNRGYYYNGQQLMTDFVFAPSNRTQSVSYANKIIQNTNFLSYYYVPDGTSPQYVTLPIANKGVPAVVFEMYQNVDNYQTVLYDKCVQVVKALNKIFAG